MSQQDDLTFMNPKTIVKWGCYVGCSIAALCVLLSIVALFSMMLFGHHPR